MTVVDGREAVEVGAQGTEIAITSAILVGKMTGPLAPIKGGTRITER